MLVGIKVARSAEMLIGLLGVHKAGGAYIPLDTNYPAERLAFMLEDARPAVLLSPVCCVGRVLLLNTRRGAADYFTG